MPLITIFTSTYNRGYVISNLYESLIRQTSKNFEWVVVDDGSTDNTDLLFSQWEKVNNGFNIRYIKTNNGGKHRAINKGIDLSEGKLFFIVDSDDYLTDDAIETVIESEKSLKNSNEFAGIAFNKGNDKKILHGKTFKGNYIDATSIERIRYNILGDKAEVFYTHILKNYKFPEFAMEKFITESVVWYKIANDGYKLRWFNKIIYIVNYLKDGLSSNSVQAALSSFQGYTYSVKEILKYKISIVEKIILIGVYTRTAKVKCLNYKEISQNIEVNILLCIILSYISMISRFLKDTKVKRRNLIS